MNKKGFTLVELIATIALLAVIAIISFVSINAILNKSKEKNCAGLVNNITSAAKEYVSDNRYSDNLATKISADKLISENYLSSPIVDPFSDKDMDPTKIDIEIELNDDYSAKNVVITTNGEKIDCENKKTFSYAAGFAAGATDDSDDSTVDNGNDNSSNTDNNTSDDSSSTGNDVSNGNTTGTTGSSNTINGSVNNGTTTTKSVQYVNTFPTGAVCAQAIDEFYTENGTTYYFTCQMSQYIYVVVNGVRYGLVDALESGVVTIAEVEAARGSKFLSKSITVSDR